VGLDTAITFPSGASETPIEVTIEQVIEPPATGAFQLLGQVLSITALDPAQNPVTNFDSFFTIVIHYEEEQLVGLLEENLMLYYWHSAEERWIPVTGVVDTEANTLTAILDHLTIFAVLDGAIQQIYLPTLHR
jgi:hypothetical protein